MTNATDRREGLSRRVEELRPILARSQDAGYLTLFDEFLRECEFELALHCVCDYLLEPQAPKPEDSTVERISALHSLMEISDDCADLLRAKVASPRASTES